MSEKPTNASLAVFGVDGTAILLPMMRITELASQFQAPFGVAWYRCKELRPDLLEVAPAASQEE